MSTHKASQMDLRILFQNERVRVAEMRAQPGDKGKMVERPARVQYVVEGKCSTGRMKFSPDLVFLQNRVSTLALKSYSQARRLSDVLERAPRRTSGFGR